eukprot:2520366-Prymnesium_polylepis.1
MATQAAHIFHVRRETMTIVAQSERHGMYASTSERRPSGTRYGRWRCGSVQRSRRREVSSSPRERV